MGVTLYNRHRPAKLHYVRQALFLVLLFAAFTAATSQTTAAGNWTTTTPQVTMTLLKRMMDPTTTAASTTTTPPTASLTTSITMTSLSTSKTPQTTTISSTTMLLKSTTSSSTIATPVTTTASSTTIPPISITTSLSTTTTTSTTTTPPTTTVISSTTMTPPTTTSTPPSTTTSPPTTTSASPTTTSPPTIITTTPTTTTTSSTTIAPSSTTTTLPTETTSSTTTTPPTTTNSLITPTTLAKTTLPFTTVLTSITTTLPTTTLTSPTTLTMPPITSSSLASSTPKTTTVISSTTTTPPITASTPPRPTVTSSTTTTPIQTTSLPPKTTSTFLTTTVTSSTSTTPPTTTVTFSTTTFPPTTTSTSPTTTLTSSTTTTSPTTPVTSLTTTTTPTTTVTSSTTMTPVTFTSTPPTATWTLPTTTTSITTSTPPATTTPERTTTAAPPASKKETYERLIVALKKINESLLKILVVIRKLLSLLRSQHTSRTSSRQIRSVWARVFFAKEDTPVAEQTPNINSSRPSRLVETFSADGLLDRGSSQQRLNFNVKSSMNSPLRSLQRLARETTDLCMPVAQTSYPCLELSVILSETEPIVLKFNKNQDDVRHPLLLQLEAHERLLATAADQNETAFQNFNPNANVSWIETIVKIVQETSDQAKIVLAEIIQTAETSSSFIVGLSISLGATALLIITLFVYFIFKNELARRRMKMVKTKVDRSEEVNIDIPNVGMSMEETQPTLQTDRIPHQSNVVVKTSNELHTSDTRIAFQPVLNEPWAPERPRPILANGNGLRSLYLPANPRQILALDNPSVRRPLPRAASYMVPDYHAPRYPIERPEGSFVRPEVFRNRHVPQNPCFERANPQQRHQPLGRMKS